MKGLLVADYQAIVEKIRSILCSENEPDPVLLGEIANEYSAALREVNERLNRAEQVLHKGHRSEALQMCDAEPRLLEAVASLDFAECEQWAEYVKEFGLPAPPTLSIDLAADLNEAYAAAEPIAKLLRSHRRLALSRAALVHRLELLRKIAAAEKGNLLWEEDLKSYETARHEELRREASSAARRNDVRVLANLELELRNTAWRARPPASILKQVSQAHADLRRKEAREQLPAIAHALTEAYSSLDPQQARELRSRWDKLLEVAELPSDAPEFELAAPALDWLAEEDRNREMQSRFELDVAALERALDEEQPKLELERLHRAATQHGQALPGILDNQYAERLRYLATREVQRFRITVISVVLVVVLISIVTAFTIRTQLRDRELQRYVDSSQGCLDNDNPDGADTILQELKRTNEDMYRAPRIQEQLEKVAAVRRKEADRRQRFGDLVQEAERLGGPKATWSTLPGALDAAKQAREIAQGEADNGQIDRLERQVKSKRKAMQDEVHSRFLAAFELLNTRFKDLAEKKWSAEHGKLQDDLQRMRDLTSIPPVEPHYLKQADLVLEKLRGMRAEQDRLATEDDFLRRVTDAIPHADQFVKALTDYVRQKDFAATPRAADFQRVSDKELPHWKGIEEWNKFLSAWSRLDFEKIDAAQAKQLLDDGKRLNAQFGAHPAGANLDEATKFLTALKQRADSEPIKQLIGTLDNKDRMFMVWTDADVRYYGDKVPVRKAGKWDFQYFVDRKMKDKGLKSFTESQIKNRTQSGGGFEWLSPQSTFSLLAVDRLRKMQDGKAGWEETFCTLIDELSKDDSMDPAEKVRLLYHVMNTAVTASQPLARAYQAIKDDFEKGGVLADVDLIKPAEEKSKEKNQGLDFGKKARELRSKCAKELSRIKWPQGVVQAASRLSLEIKQTLSRPAYDWVAWLRKDRSGEWICQARERPDEAAAGELFILSVSADGKDLKFEKIGHLKNRQLKIDTALDFEKVEGRPVFLQKKPEQQR